MGWEDLVILEKNLQHHKRFKWAGTASHGIQTCITSISTGFLHQSRGEDVGRICLECKNTEYLLSDCKVLKYNFFYITYKIYIYIIIRTHLYMLICLFFFN